MTAVRKFPGHACFDLALLRGPDGRPLMPRWDGAQKIERFSGLGICRWCGCAITDEKTGEISKRRTWHKECLYRYLVCTNAQFMRDHLWRERPHRCEECDRDLEGKHWKPDGRLSQAWIYDSADRCSYQATLVVEADSAAPWEADHIVPLHLVDRTDPMAWTYWAPRNVRILCLKCHKGVTARQAAARAKVERIRQKRGVGKPKVGKIPF